MIVSGSNKYANPHHYEHPNHKHMVESRYYHEHKPKAQRICGPTKQSISNLEYNILMNNPQYENQTLTSKLFHCGPDEDQCLFKIIESKRASRVNFRALCPNIYIQKLRIIYLLLLTQSYHPLYNLKLSTSIVTHNFSENNLHNDSSSKISGSENQQSENQEFKTALNILRVMIYQDKKIDGVRCKYLAEFFQFLQYDFQNYKQKNVSKIKNELERHKENIVINILNKYPILDQIFIDILIYEIEKKAEETGGLNIDDNYNIKVFLSQGLGLNSNFTSNWQFYIENINVIIGIDMFTLDYNIYNYFSQIIQTLDQNGLLNGLDVSKVGGFDEQVFNKLDMSYILDLKDVLSNCSESRHDQFFLGGSNSLHGSKNQVRKVSSIQLANGSNVSTKYNITHYNNILQNINEISEIENEGKKYKRSENPQSSRNSPLVNNIENGNSQKYNQPQVFSKFHHTHMSELEKISDDSHKHPQKKLIFIPKNNHSKEIVTRPSTNYVKTQNKEQVIDKEKKIVGNSNEINNQNRYRIHSSIEHSKLSLKDIEKPDQFQNISEKQRQKRRQSEIRRQMQMQKEQLRRQYQLERQQRENQRLKRQRQRAENQKAKLELQRQRERQKIIERERQRQIEFKKKLELQREVQRQIEIQKQKQRRRQIEIQEQIKRERQQRQRVERQRQEIQRRNKQRQAQIQLEKERQRQFLAERERQRQKNVEKQRQIQVEKILEEQRTKQREKERERIEKQKQTQREKQQYELRSNYSGISLRSGNQILQGPYSGLEANQSEKNIIIPKPTFNVVRHNSNKIEQLKPVQPYFFSRKNSKMTEKNSETFQDISSINEPNKIGNQPFIKQVIKLNSNMKYEPIKPMSQKIYRKEDEQTVPINNPTILTTEGAKKFLRELYQQPQKRTTPLKTSEILKQEQNSKGFIHLRQKITESSKKNMQGSHEVLSSGVFSQNQQNSLDIMKRVPSTSNGYTNHNNVLYSLNDHTKMKDSGTFSSTNNNTIYYNNYPSMRKRVQSQIFTNQKDKITTQKTEGQIMWEKHKMKNSYDPNLFKKQVHSTVQVNAQPIYRNNYNNMNTTTSINTLNSISYQPPAYVYKTLNKNEGSSKTSEYSNMGTNISIKTQKLIDEKKNMKGREEHKPITLGQISSDKYYRLSSLKSEQNGKKMQIMSHHVITNPRDDKIKEKPFYIPEKYQQMNNNNLISHPAYNPLNNGTNTTNSYTYNNPTLNYNSTNNTSMSQNNSNIINHPIQFNNYIPPSNVYTYINPNAKAAPIIHHSTHTSMTERPIFNEKTVVNTPLNSQSNRPPSYSQLGNNYSSTHGLKL